MAYGSVRQHCWHLWITASNTIQHITTSSCNGSGSISSNSSGSTSRRNSSSSRLSSNTAQQHQWLAMADRAEASRAEALRRRAERQAEWARMSDNDKNIDDEALAISMSLSSHHLDVARKCARLKAATSALGVQTEMVPGTGWCFYIALHKCLGLADTKGMLKLTALSVLTIATQSPAAEFDHPEDPCLHMSKIPECSYIV